MARQKSRKNKIADTIIIFSVAVVIVIGLLISNKHKSDLYQTAYNYYQNGMFIEAADIFDGLKNYKDSIEQVKRAHYSAAVDLISSNQSLACDQFELAGEYEDASLNYELLKICLKFSNWKDGNSHSLESIQELSVYSNCVAYLVFADTPIGQELIMLQGNWVSKPTWDSSNDPEEYYISGGSWKRTKGVEKESELIYVNGKIYLYYFGTDYYDSIEANGTNSAVEYDYYSELGVPPRKYVWTKKDLFS